MIDVVVKRIEYFIFVAMLTVKSFLRTTLERDREREREKEKEREREKQKDIWNTVNKELHTYLGNGARREGKNSQDTA